jgi:DNA-binding NtrC family response regulator
MTDTTRYETVHPKDRALFASIDKVLAEYERTRKAFARSPAQHLPRSVPCSATVRRVRRRPRQLAKSRLPVVRHGETRRNDHGRADAARGIAGFA